MTKLKTLHSHVFETVFLNLEYSNLHIYKLKAFKIRILKLIMP